MADDELSELLGEQIDYYRARAIEYDATAPAHGRSRAPRLAGRRTLGRMALLLRHGETAERIRLIAGERVSARER